MCCSGPARFAEVRDFGMDQRRAMRTKIMHQNRIFAVGIAALSAALVAVPLAGNAEGRKTAMTCTNPVSGVFWKIAIDFDKATVDSNKAEITEAKISWFDPTDGGNYTLDRRSGDLTAIVASSTGGYFRRSRCSPQKSQ